MSDEKQDNTPPSASEDFRNKESGDINGGINNKLKKKKYEVEPPKLMKIQDFYSTFPWGL